MKKILHDLRVKFHMRRYAKLTQMLGHGVRVEDLDKIKAKRAQSDAWLLNNVTDDDIYEYSL